MIDVIEAVSDEGLPPGPTGGRQWDSRANTAREDLLEHSSNRQKVLCPEVATVPISFRRPTGDDLVSC